MAHVIRYRVLACLIALVTVFGAVITAAPSAAFAAGTELNFDSTDVLNDLTSSTADGQAFDLKDYPYDESKQAQVIHFAEYCYSYKANMRNNYGLYVYIYNPQGLNLSTTSKSNKIQMAVRYDADGNPSDYAKFDLQFLSKSEESNYKNLFYKFKVVDKVIDGKTFAQRVNSNERRYDVSGVELMTYGANNATDYPVNGTYIFTGYAAGYGPDANAKSTLASTVEYLETVSLNVKHTFYRTQTSVKGAGYQNQLDTVYFAVPKRFFDTYGKLQRIKAEWYEYKTNDIVVTSHQDFYDKAYPYLGIRTGEFDGFGMTEYNKDIYYSLGQNAGDAGGGMNMAKWGWNLGSGYLHVPAPALYYLFKVGNISEYDPYADIVSIGGVESNALYEYILNYDKSFNKGTLPVKEGTISADLFADDIDDYRKLDTEYGKIQNGYSYYDFDADVDLQKLTSWQEGNPSFWDNWVNWGLWDAIFGGIPQEESRTVSPIYTLKDSDLSGTNAEIAERLLINANDVNALKTYHTAAKNDDCVTVLFRFATSDYYSAAVDIMELGKGFLGSDKYTKGQAYRAYESVFLDFDIIQLTFNKDGVYKVIPAVSSPIDVVNAITPPVQMPDDTPWWVKLLSVLLVILLLVLTVKLLTFIFRKISQDRKIKKTVEKHSEKKENKELKKAERTVDKTFKRRRKNRIKENKRMIREAKKVDVGKLKEKVFSGEKSRWDLSKAERYALEQDEEYAYMTEIYDNPWSPYDEKFDDFEDFDNW